MKPGGEIDFDAMLDPQGRNENWMVVDRILQEFWQGAVVEDWLDRKTAPYPSAHRRGYKIPVDDVPCYN